MYTETSKTATVQKQKGPKNPVRISTNTIQVKKKKKRNYFPKGGRFFYGLWEAPLVKQRT